MFPCLTVMFLVVQSAFAFDSPGGDFQKTLDGAVHADGWVNYVKLAKDPQDLHAYTAFLATVALPKEEAQRKTLLINAYNAFTLSLIIEHPGIHSIQEIPEPERWVKARWNIGGTQYSLDQIENQLLRPMGDPRIHYALNCASIGCPPLRNQVYKVSELSDQLDDQGRIIHRVGSRWFAMDPVKGVLRVSEIYNWFEQDFREGTTDTRITVISKYQPQVKALTSAKEHVRLEFLPWDWQLNSVTMSGADENGSK